MNKNDAKNDLLSFLAENTTKNRIYAIREKVNISTTILKKRLELNMNQKEFAEYMHVSQGMVSKWESAEYNFTIEAISNICNKLNLIFHVEIIKEEDEMNYLNSIKQNDICINDKNVEWGNLIDIYSDNSDYSIAC
jgi:transcriptional regulator with XRE-family HTH domain